eukprot:6979286-Pyramimonas_sp.AAC.1
MLVVWAAAHAASCRVIWRMRIRRVAAQPLWYKCCGGLWGYKDRGVHMAIAVIRPAVVAVGGGCAWRVSNE